MDLHLANEESIKSLVKAYNAAKPHSKEKIDGDLILAKLSTVSEFKFFKGLCDSTVNDALQALKDPKMDSVTTAVLRGLISGMETMLSLIETAKENLKDSPMEGQKSKGVNQYARANGS